MEVLLEFPQPRSFDRGASVSSSFPSGPRLGGSPLLRQGRQWPAGKCKVKQRPHELTLDSVDELMDELVRFREQVDSVEAEEEEEDEDEDIEDNDHEDEEQDE